ncbi:MAG: glutamine synthetase family protein [Candidatus Thorarchaeota archaeon]|nr:glutamine synthetase family protein [Candidatus Thorarchaeota archaeon]
MDGKQTKPEFLRLIFTSILGATHSIELAYDRKEEVFEDGVFFDGSSVRGYADVNSSDMLLHPIYNNPVLATWDPLMEIVPCSVHHVSGSPHMSDPVNILRHVSDKALEKGYVMMAGFELEFFLLGLKDAMVQPADKAGYFATTPADRGLQFRRDVMMSLSGMGIGTTTHHHEVANGQHEIGLKHGPASDTATSLMLAKHVIAELATRKGLTATFMAKPFVSMNGSGMHIHQSMWTDDLSSNLFATDKASEVSEIAGHYVAGILEHARALSAIVAPTVNSFKRLVPGFEAPTRIAWGPRNRTTMMRIPHFNGSARSARVEFRCPDPSCSPHLALAAILAAGMDGITNKMDPPEPTEKDLFHGVTDVETLPVSLTDALDALHSNSLLLDSLGSRVIETYLTLKKAEWSRYIDSTDDPGPFEVTDWEIEEYLHCN